MSNNIRVITETNLSADGKTTGEKYIVIEVKSGDALLNYKPGDCFVDVVPADGIPAKEVTKIKGVCENFGYTFVEPANPEPANPKDGVGSSPASGSASASN